MKFKITKENIYNNNPHDTFNYDKIINTFKNSLFSVDNIFIQINLDITFELSFSNNDMILYIIYENNNYLINTLGSYNIDVINDIVNIIKGCRIE